MIVGGDSAGGHLAALAALRRARPVLAQLLVYPALDPACDERGLPRSTRHGPMLTRERDAGLLGRPIVGAARPGDAEASRARRRLAGVPPAWIAVAEHDPLRDDGLALRRGAAAPRASASSSALYEDMTHGFLRWGGVVEPRARADRVARRRRARRCWRRLAAAPTSETTRRGGRAVCREER